MTGFFKVEALTFTSEVAPRLALTSDLCRSAEPCLAAKPGSRTSRAPGCTLGVQSRSPSTYGLLAARDPALVAFRNCIASYSAREVGKDVDGTWADLLIRATEGECRARFDDMAQMLSKRFGEKRVELVMQQLIETTLLPAAKARGKPDAQALAVPPRKIVRRG